MIFMQNDWYAKEWGLQNAAQAASIAKGQRGLGWQVKRKVYERIVSDEICVSE